MPIVALGTSREAGILQRLLLTVFSHTLDPFQSFDGNAGAAGKEKIKVIPLGARFAHKPEACIARAHHLKHAFGADIETCLARGIKGKEHISRY